MMLRTKIRSFSFSGKELMSAWISIVNAGRTVILTVILLIVSDAPIAEQYGKCPQL